MNDQDYMKLALQLAKGTAGQTSPNPVVGAVLVKNHQIVGMGAHLKAGDPHAEVHAVRMAAENAEGATLYVTLEPCSHYGRTPPCADLVINSGIKRVVIATADPNPEVAGKGLEKLERAGLAVEVGLLGQEAAELNRVFFHYIKTGLPYVTLKSAVTLDGKTATATGDSKWITSEPAREDVHQFRHRHDAILVGVNTIIKDNPSLTTRLGGGGKNPVRVILDSRLRTPLDSHFVTDGQAPVWIMTGNIIDPRLKKAFIDKGVVIIKLDSEEVEVPAVLAQLGQRGITSLYVEGGAEVHGSFLKNNAFDQVVTYIAPKLLGGREAPGSFGGEGISRMSDAVGLEIVDVTKLGGDIRVIARKTQGEA
ncbi:bifunctional diaminohydroxyphosphoribosylaminopyrimidine deaminase/5-amino-6-(5-phosphoribosylamino)uracil reductase RibD [Bacillus sp. T33-2]|uniref:bifunctional diaminohydroxyphosphoribosylaminopyrimidine deaminase/5-amino-6-(5-phosphoribosylamino)uracil reductase RibD n=1 Tax=Bacillus sp. T33-2 TaxID=2054168 RepID=UPI000C77E659|nr:bifunctional diaminohydroxyphosphoribosylaminopyrimidine deaminase/5-amino-6-(5-phosphoribosylamino)uracil reductase RibD [Bacillus sp. T33-2]PLR95084.1 riboflavin biosynthesis protein RibD [Bacillus sp. T33-2]